MVANRQPEEPLRLSRRRLKRSEYDLLVAEGAFEGERVELLFGEIVEMAAQKPPHSLVSRRLAMTLTLALHGRAGVQSHSPIVGAGESEPEPDLAVYRPEDDLSGDHPTHVHLVVEVAYSSRRRDLGLKRRLYALTNIPEYWVVDVARREVRVMRDPAGDDYGTVTTHAVGSGTQLALLAFPDVVVAIDPLFAGL